MVNGNKRSLYLLYMVTFLMFTEYFVYQTVTPLYILTAGGNEFYSGLQSTLYLITAIILRFYFGPLADRKGNKAILLVGVIVFTTAPLLFMLSQNMLYIILIRMYQAIGLATYCSCASSLTSILAPKDRVGTYIGIHRLIIMSSLIIGPSVTLKTIELYGYSAFHILGTLEGIVALVFLFYVKEPKTEIPGRKEDSTFNLGSVLRMLSLLKEKPLNDAYRRIFLVSLIEALVLSFGSIYISVLLPYVNPGILFTYFGVGSVAGSIVSGILSDFKSKQSIAYICTTILGVGILGLAFLPVVPFFLYVGGIMAGFGFSGTMTASIPIIIQSAKGSERTAALSLQESSNDIGVAIGSLIFGILIPYVGIPVTFAIGGIGLLIFCLLEITRGYFLKEHKLFSQR